MANQQHVSIVLQGAEALAAMTPVGHDLLRNFLDRVAEAQQSGQSRGTDGGT